MRSRLTNAVLGGAAVLVVVTGCSESKAGTPTAANTTTTPTGSAQPTGPGSADRHGAPPVNNPLDVTKYLTDPCAAISPRLLQSLGLPMRGESDNQGLPSCMWSTDAGFSAVAFSDGRKGLTDLYQRQERGFWEFWEVTTVEGYPAVFADIADRRSSGHCVLYVAPSDPVRFQVSEQDRLRERSCDRAKLVATAVVRTMKGEG